MKYEKIGNYVDLKQGMAINAKSNHLVSDVETSLPLLRIADMPTKRKEVFMSEDTPKRFWAEPEDIIYTRTGQVGLVFRNQFGVVHNNCFRVQILDNKKLDKGYLYWVLQLKSIYEYANSIAAGVAQPDLPHKSFKSIKIPIHDIDKQKEIALILDRYESLIDLNNKRIKLLEQTAQEIYKEWFVRFRFPGYEKAEFDSGVPKGWVFGEVEKSRIPREWHYGELKELGEFVRGKNITAEKMEEGDIPVISAGIEPSGYHNQANVKGYSITMSASGANAGYLKYNLEDIWCADCSYYQNKNNIWYVYNSLRFIQSVINNLQVGSAQPHVYPKNINRLSIPIPEDDLVKKFNDLCIPIYEEIKTLQSINKNTIQQRDYLLPRLMSGKLEV